MSSTPRTNMLLPIAIVDLIRDRAKANHRTMTAEMQLVIEAGLAVLEKPEKPTPRRRRVPNQSAHAE